MTGIRAVLFDLDGVIRHFHPEHVAAIERAHDLSPGTIEAVAFAAPLIDEVTTGRITRAEWVRAVGERIGDHDAAEVWGRQPFTPDAEVLALADELRAAGYTTAVLTNGTDGIPAEVASFGLHDRVDAVFSSHEIGFAKPDVRAFRHVLDVLDLDGPEVFFTDDSERKLAGAEELGMRVHHFTGADGLRAALRSSGIDLTDAGGSTYRARIDLLAEAVDGFEAVLRSGDHRAVVPSCPGWTLTDLAGHLTDVHRWALGQLTGTDPEAPEPADLADRFRAGADRLVAALRARPADAACSAIYPPDTAGTWARRQLHETTIHLWDAQQAVGGEPRLQADTAADGVREAVGDLYPRQVRLGRVDPLSQTVVFRFPDADGEAELVGTAGAGPAVRVTGRAEDLLLVLWGRRPLDTVAVTIDGDRSALDQALATKLVP
ncbi:HAD-IA family hydrolase [Curtobacterium sp. YR515]|uniref:HAD-IA family hydrolase n=1 Tax=Curtobacterium sp. YR515 TaxID=1855316 RepID=UPI0008E239DA|nr:HAD-IA family hydrolase [Curtobacterium sp. YR515]SFF60632.1 haloacid dehalogenase superfamily, subfamily IA, variant 3 with third motif having DD or ED [Curtobacterium sp. YR515]